MSSSPISRSGGGLLGHASILTLTSYPERTTPVLRGKWILENILGRHVPPPPANLDTSLEIPEDEGTVRKPTIRERLARHRTEPMCASCHRTIDPLGFALEAYDAAGGLRYIDELGNPVDDTGLWPETEQEIKGLPGLRNLILENREQFVRTVTTKLMQYALGRDVEYYDQPAIRKIIRDATAEDHTWSSIILGIVESPQFLMRMSAPHGSGGGAIGLAEQGIWRGKKWTSSPVDISREGPFFAAPERR